MLVEKLQAVTIYLDRTPGMRIDQVGKVNGQLIGVQVIRATIKLTGNPAHGSGIHIDGFIAQALELQGPEVVLVQVVESVLFGCFHDKLLVVSAQNWTNHKVT
jgi:hypothetical protein